MSQKCMSISFLHCSNSSLTALGKLNRFQVQDSAHIHSGIHWPAHHFPRRTSPTVFITDIPPPQASWLP